MIEIAVIFFGILTVVAVLMYAIYSLLWSLGLV